jgi:hypothetical protein
MIRGVKLQPRPRTQLGRLWWEWLEAYATGAERLAKSLDYARAGNVTNVDIGPAQVTARVWGSRQTPYDVSWRFVQAPEADWAVFETLATPETLRELRKGVVTNGLLASLGAAGIPLLPVRYQELKPHCSCPDWIRPCKHALALLRILGDLIEDDPLLILRLRGGLKDREPAPPPETFAEPLRESDAEFWGSPTQVLALLNEIPPNATPAGLLSRLGPISIYGVKTDPALIFRPVYEAVAAGARSRKP